MTRSLLVGSLAAGLLALGWGPLEPSLAARQSGSGAGATASTTADRTQAATRKPVQAKKDDTAKPAPAARVQAPDQQAYSEAYKVADPDKKIEAMRNLIAEFPESSYVSAAENQILSALIKKTADDLKQVQEQAKKITETPAESNSRGGGVNYGTVATALLNGDVLLEDAETYAVKNLEALSDETQYVEAQKKAFAQRQADAQKRNPNAKPLTMPDEATYARNFRSARQSGLNTLAQIYEKRGKLAEAEKTYRETFTLQPKGSAAAMAAIKLAEFAKEAGRDQEQLEYLTVAALAGRLKAPGWADLEAVYKKMHGGSDDGLDDMLDARYEKEAFAFEVTPYVRPKNRSDRTVLAEIFTGSGCPPCVGADLAFEAAMKRYKPAELAVLMYHLHIPQPDPMTNPSTQSRQAFYNRDKDKRLIPGVPTYFIDGVGTVGGGGAESAPTILSDKVEPAVEKELTTKAGVKLALQASMPAPALVRVKADVGKARASAGKLRLHIALAEEQVRYSGENGVRFHPMVVRSMATSAADIQGFAVQAGKSLQVEYTFDIAKIVAEAKAHLDDFEVNNTRFGKFQFSQKKHQIDLAHLVVVAFVQDETSNKVLQAIFVPVRPSGAPTD